MIRLSYFVIALVIMLLGQSCDNRQEEINEKHKKKLTAAIEKFNNAFKKGDVKTIKTMVTSDYMHTNGNAKPITKQEWLKFLFKRSKKMEKGHFKILDYRMTEEEIRLYGPVGALSAKIESTTLVKGDTVHSAYRITNVWVRIEGRWKRAAFHDSKIE